MPPTITIACQNEIQRRRSAAPSIPRARATLAQEVFDFRSDTVTQPTPAMLEAMCTAPLGDDVYHEDPTVMELEQRVADTFGAEAGLFCTSGTLSNQLALRYHLSVLDQVISAYSILLKLRYRTLRAEFLQTSQEPGTKHNPLQLALPVIYGYHTTNGF